MLWRRIVLVAMTLLVIGALLYFLTKRPLSRQVSPQDLRQFSGQLASLIASGQHSFTECLRLTAQKTSNPYLRGVILSILTSGRPSPLHKAMERYPDVFTEEYIFAVKYGFGMARADAVLRQLSEQWPDDPSKRWEVVRRIIKPLALSSLKDSDWVTRLNGLKALATLEGKDAIPHLLPLLNDPNPRVQAEAKKTLQQLGYKVGE
ncbi:HEAT repeat domain-containing protein [Fervidibacter sacchari]|jgi:Type II secretory pathway, component PulF|uniref:HEAT repeat domain-containing protein n=1 Tax=Candidatus Fervidibacter sacchari TaxID=1448929 RepID=A0ABT2EIG2_9BACT|nr:HEAT repeat domain-containing protein [Candidatus Fervidibacter sacchari]MCS3917732.1 hypothetical protein [Candidatus Fervidibacter sacchari]WKU15557.1 HEAT repeat domain-containing protein [Candidatus Fervidibacter sacchari]